MTDRNEDQATIMQRLASLQLDLRFLQEEVSKLHAKLDLIAGVFATHQPSGYPPPRSDRGAM